MFLRERVGYINSLRFRTLVWSRKYGLPRWPLFHPLDSVAESLTAIRSFVIVYNTRVSPNDVLAVSEDLEWYNCVVMCQEFFRRFRMITVYAYAEEQDKSEFDSDHESV
ncbi:hypothetical protein SISSUDRAFT_1068215 [Sistotremastrum suecicum HHB10207 ss-3]|uniref:Uncharacterized protein n=1 Tax=Sistotremastrum suecicum HHB10207 ss-3 TaxID=1314776 RepID=A0A165WDK1_9AGAM|nr:hypothetical protein SISSUDRAFT_1068215 [Sistotremastrum suecicum HHB10207 ss-3]